MSKSSKHIQLIQDTFDVLIPLPKIKLVARDKFPSEWCQILPKQEMSITEAFEAFEICKKHFDKSQLPTLDSSISLLEFYTQALENLFAILRIKTLKNSKKESRILAKRIARTGWDLFYPSVAEFNFLFPKHKDINEINKGLSIVQKYQTLHLRLIIEYDLMIHNGKVNFLYLSLFYYEEYVLSIRPTNPLKVNSRKFLMNTCDALVKEMKR